MRLKIKIALLATLLIAPLLAAQSGPALDNILARLATYRDAKETDVVAELAAYVRAVQNKPEASLACEKRLDAFLETEITPEARLSACRALREIGTAASVPVLGRMLNEPGTADPARYALERIPAPEAEAALLVGLGRAAGGVRLGIISSLAGRRAAKAVPALAALAAGPDKAAAEASVGALGTIGGGDAAAALLKLLDKSGPAGRNAAAAALVGCAGGLTNREPAAAIGIYDRLLAGRLPLPIRRAAFSGKISLAGGSAPGLILATLRDKKSDLRGTALAAASAANDAGLTKEICGLFPALQPAEQVMALAAISRFRTPEVLAAVKAGTTSPDAAVRAEALRRMGSLGDAGGVALLAAHAARSAGDEQRIARESLAVLDGPGVDEAVLAGFERAAEPAEKAEYLTAIADRRMPAGKVALLRAALDPERPVRLAALRGLRGMSEPAEIPVLLGVLTKLADETDRDEFGDVIAAVAGRTPASAGPSAAVARAYAEAKTAGERAALIMVLGKIGDDPSLPLVRKALRSADPGVRDAAVRAVAAWPTVAARHDALALARTSQDVTHRVLALQGVVRIVSLEPYQDPAAAVAVLKEALSLADRPEEKRQALAALGRFACREGLALAESLASDPAVGKEAKIAADRIRKAQEK